MQQCRTAVALDFLACMQRDSATAHGTWPNQGKVPSAGTPDITGLIAFFPQLLEVTDKSSSGRELAVLASSGVCNPSRAEMFHDVPMLCLLSQAFLTSSPTPAVCAGSGLKGPRHCV